MKTVRILKAAILAGLMAFGGAFSATAAMPEPQDAGPVVDSGETRSRLVPAGDHILLHLNPTEGWHTYWVNPGDSGMATSISFDLPDGVTAGEIDWPTPDRILYGPLANFGYTGEVYLPVKLEGDIPPGTEITAQADWLVCEEICIPEGAELTVTMGGDTSENAALLAAVMDTLPVSGGDGLFETADGNLRVEVAWPLGDTDHPEDVTFFPYKDGIIANAQPVKWGVDGDRLVLSVERGLRPMPDAFQAVVKIAAEDGSKGYNVDLSSGSVAVAALTGNAGGGAAASAGGSTSVGTGGFVQALLFAFVGGIILNLMPCVFPVLSIKAMAIAQSAGQGEAKRRAEGLYYTLGVLVSFAVIGGALLALRAGGEAIGWGFQLQSPLFVTLMAFILFTMGLSFSGLFSLGGGFTGVGQSLTERKGHSGAFFTGTLATLVATPCTAPFMAGALGSALVLPAAMGFVIFLALGLGLALPILLISFSPAVGRLLPRPGNWMVTFRQFLAFLLYATVVWLLWVLGRQVGVDGLALALFGLVVISFLVWLVGKGAGKGPARFARAGGVVAALALLVAGAFAIGNLPQGGNAMREEAALSAEVYSAERLDQHLAEGAPVFVNFTADWCITCLANERVALSSDKVRQAFNDSGVRYMKGDWTNRDDNITAMLQRFGRSGVPLYLYYPAGVGQGGEPHVLPQILTPGTIVSVITESQPLREARLSDDSQNSSPQPTGG